MLSQNLREVITPTKTTERPFPFDPDFSFTSDLEYEAVLQKFLEADRRVGDLHVMYQTLKYEHLYTGDRDYDIPRREVKQKKPKEPKITHSFEFTESADPMDLFIEEKGLYHVFIRGEDPFGKIESRVKPEFGINLIASFASELAAVNWIVKHGKEVLRLQAGMGDLVLTIIYLTNSQYEYDNYPTELEYISEARNPTFAFDKYAYNMLLNEHKRLIEEGTGLLVRHYDHSVDTPEIVPYWINRVCKRNKCATSGGCKNGIMRGCTQKHFDKLLEKCEPETVSLHRSDFEEMQSNPDALVQRKRAYDLHCTGKQVYHHW
jgi:hypothetical protein